MGSACALSRDRPQQCNATVLWLRRRLRGQDFQGHQPADLPVEQPMKFELIINLKTAKQLGLTIPQSILFQADKLIK